MPAPTTRWACLAVLAAAVLSCTDVVSPLRRHPGAAGKTIDVSVATVALDIVYDGASIGSTMVPPGTPSLQGDRCFNLTLDGQPYGSFCGKAPVPNLPPGTHTIGLQDQVPVPGSATFNAVDVQPPVSVDLVGGDTTPVSFDITSVRGKVVGAVQVNGQAPSNSQYQACLVSSCGDLVNGAFTLLSRLGAGTVRVRSMPSSSSLVDLPYTATAGTTTDLGTTNVVLGSIALDVIYAGQSIGSSIVPPGTPSLQGDRCFTPTIDGVAGMPSVCGTTTIPNIAPGPHTIGLQDQVPMPGSATFSMVDVQPPVSITVVGGQSIPVSFDVSAVRGKVTGAVQVNGQVAPNYQYQVCLANSCGDVVNGTFTLLSRLGAGVVHVRSMPAFSSLADIPFTATASTTVDLGTTNIQLGSLAIDVTYDGQSIGSSNVAPGTSVTRGDRCFTLTIDGVPNMNSVCGTTTVPNVTPGPHSIGLQDQVPVPGSAMFTSVDVQPPVPITVVGGEASPVSFDISGVRGKISGVVHVNGQIPPNNQYMVCLKAGTCADLVGGQIDMFARTGSGVGYLRAMPMPTNLAQFSFIVAAGKTTLIGGVSTADPGSTPSGTNVSVEPVNQTDGTSNTTVSMTFSDVTSTGTTTVVQSAVGSPPPTGLQLGTPPLYFDLSTTATFTGPVQVCINYTGTTFAVGATLALLHGDGSGAWTDVTTSLDTVNRIICGSVTSFSPFVVASRTASQPPTVTPVLSGTAGTDGWYTSNVTVTWDVSGNGSAITSRVGCDETQVTANTGGTTFTCTAATAGGSTSKSVTVKRDATPPTVTPSVSGPLGDNGWYRGDVTVGWSASDETSGVSSAPCAAVTLSVDNAGTSYACSATNGAGLTASAQQVVKRDATAPVVAYAGNAGSYTVDQQIAISCSASDAMSGIAEQHCDDVSGAAYTFALGANTVAASAVDRAGNEGTASASFTVSVTTTSLCALTTSFASDADVAASLCAKLDAAAASRQRGSMNAARNQIGAFVNEVRAQSGKGFTTGQAAVLIRLAGAL